MMMSVRDKRFRDDDGDPEPTTLTKELQSRSKPQRPRAGAIAGCRQEDHRAPDQPPPQPGDAPPQPNRIERHCITSRVRVKDGPHAQAPLPSEAGQLGRVWPKAHEHRKLRRRRAPERNSRGAMARFQLFARAENPSLGQARVGIRRVPPRLHIPPIPTKVQGQAVGGAPAAHRIKTSIPGTPAVVAEDFPHVVAQG